MPFWTKFLDSVSQHLDWLPALPGMSGWLRQHWQKRVRQQSVSLLPYIKTREPDTSFAVNMATGSLSNFQQTVETTFLSVAIYSPQRTVEPLFQPRSIAMQSLPLPKQQIQLCFILLHPPRFQVSALPLHPPVSLVQPLLTCINRLTVHTQLDAFQPAASVSVRTTALDSLTRASKQPKSRLKTMRFLTQAEQANPAFFQMPLALRPTRVADLSPEESSHYLKLLAEQAGCTPGRLVLRRVYRSVPVSVFQEFSMRPSVSASGGVGKAGERSFSMQQLLKTKDWLWATPKLDSVSSQAGDKGYYKPLDTSPMMDLIFGLRLDTQEALRAVVPTLC